MSEVSKKVAFLKGMAEGMGLEKEEDAKSKLIARMLEAMEEMADAMDAMEARQDEAEQYIDELDSDLGDVEEVLFADDDEDDEDAGVDFIEYECPHCHTSVYYDQEAFDLEEEHLCPECGRELFPNAPDEEE